MYSKSFVTAALLAPFIANVRSFDIAPNPSLSQRRQLRYYRGKPDTRDPLWAERVAWNKAVDERKAAKRAAKLATKGGV